MIQYFLMTAEQAEEYFNRVIMKEAVTEKEKVAVLKAMEQEGKVISRGITSDTQEEFVEKLSEQANVFVVFSFMVICYAMAYNVVLSVFHS